MKHIQLHQSQPIYRTSTCDLGQNVEHAIYGRSCDHQCPHDSDHMGSTSAGPDVTDVSKIAGIHRSQSIGQAIYGTRPERCLLPDCNRPITECVPMVECPGPNRTLLRTNSGKIRNSIPVDMPRYFVLEQQPS